MSGDLSQPKLVRNGSKKGNKVIDTFKDKYDFLSNFHPCIVMFEGKPYPSTEHAYQAAKFVDEDHKEKIRTATTARKAKRLGQAKRPAKCENWEHVKVSIMRDLVKQKFQKYPKLRAKLLATGQHMLIEGNHWNDTFWGVCKGVGENWLGRILMEIRAELTVFEVHTPNEAIGNTETSSIFLAGPTPRATKYPEAEIGRSWRPDAIELIRQKGIVEKVYNPEYITPKFDYDHQVDWEFAALKAAKVILFWVPRDLKLMPGFTTNVEFGYWLGKQPEKVVLGFPPEADKMMYLKHMARLHGVPIFNTLEDTIDGAVKKMEPI